LQLSRIELVSAINQELEKNPLLEEEHFDDLSENEPAQETDIPKISTKTKEITGEEDGREDFDWDNFVEYFGSADAHYSRDDSETPPLENMLTKSVSLADHLLWQLNLSRFTEEERKIGEQIIGNLDSNGYLMLSAGDIAATMKTDSKQVEETIKKIQEFDPTGVAARDLQECLLIQLNFLGAADSLAGKIIRDHLRDLETKNYENIVKRQKVSLAEVREAVNLIGTLNPKPGLLYNDERPQYVIPDVFVFKVGDEYRIVLNDDGLPKLRISNMYKEIMNDMDNNSKGGMCKEYIKEKLQSATWLIKSIQQRQRTIYRVSESILKHQKDYFNKGISYLKPMVLRDIAEDIGMHESTISRVTTNKYIHTPRGIFELKYFFSSAINKTNGELIASESVKEKIEKIIREEDKGRPYNDSQLVEILKASGISIARRTVAKYRDTLRILPSSKRKNVFIQTK
jgi:RNA polymerase sigma-54 factor